MEKFRSTDISEDSETTDEESFEDWSRNTRKRFFGEGNERVEHEDLEAPDSSYRDRPLREFREQFPNEYVEPWETPVRTEEFRHPEKFADEINPKYHRSAEYKYNCCDCARAVERTWRGHQEAAAGKSLDSDPSKWGEQGSRMELWAGEGCKSMSAKEIRDRIASAGHGSSGIVSARFKARNGSMMGHAFNIVNDGGEIKAVDGQVGMVESWNSRTGHPGMSHVFDRSGEPGKLMVMGWDAKGRSLW